MSVVGSLLGGRGCAKGGNCLETQVDWRMKLDMATSVILGRQVCKSM